MESSNIEYTVLSRPAAYRVLFKDIAHNLVKIIRGKRRKRTSRRVQYDYDQHMWKSVLDTKEWMECETLFQYVVRSNQTIQIALIDHRLVRIRNCDWRLYRMQALQDIMKTYAGDQSVLYELGCGFGINLFSVYLADHWDHLAGFDISPNGIKAARETARHFHLDNMAFDLLDLTDAQDPNFGKLRGKTVFTYLCLEQLKYVTEVVIENLIRAQVQRVIHIEPAVELLRWWSMRDLATYLYHVRMDYQDNLVSTLRAFEKKGRINIVEMKRLYYSPKYRDGPFLGVWEPVG